MSRKNPFEMFSEEELPEYHQMSFDEISNEEAYRKYLIEKRKKQYSKFGVEYVEDLDTGIEVKFMDFEIPVKTIEKDFER